MIKENILHRILYTGAGLVILVTIIFPLASILYLILDWNGNATPEGGIPFSIVIGILHFLIFYAFWEAIKANKRKAHLRNVVFIVSCTGLIILGVIILTIAREFLGYHDFYISTIAFCFCFVCDFLAALIALIAIFLQPQK